MSGIGKAITAYGSNAFLGSLGVVQLGFAGWDLGLTVDATTLKSDFDIKDIMFQQKGTKAYDHYITGAEMVISGSFGEISTELLKIIIPYLVQSGGSVGSDSLTFGTPLYKSMMDEYANVLRVIPIVDQCPSENIEDIMNFYRALFIINGDLINWAADAQRNLPFEIRIKSKPLTLAESASKKHAFGYMGDPTQEDLPAAVWPDLNAPYIVSSAATAATTVTLALSEDATQIAGVTSTEQIIVKVDEKFVVPTTVLYAANVVTLTLPAASIAAGQIVETSVGESTWEDATNNENSEIISFTAVNSI